VNRHFYTKLSLMIVTLCMPILVFSQDIHFSNFGFSPLNINPGLTGIFPGDWRVNASFRDQWQNVPVSYRTFGVAVDTRLGDFEKNPDRRWSAGAYINYDKAGYGDLSNLTMSLAGAYRVPLSINQFLNAGASIGLNQRRFNVDKLTWDDQYINKKYESSFISPDAALFNKTSSYATLNLGVDYHYQQINKRTALDLGVGIFNINQPKHGFIDETNVALERRYSLYGGGNIQISRHFDLLGEVMTQWQGPHKELLGSIGGRFYIVDNKTKVFALQGGISLRGADAYSPHVGLIYNNWRVAVNFDGNFSQFTTATNRLGGPEVSLIYIFQKVPPGTYCPVCPTFL
jgi:type IX secretion system PorP/SprF family membrane protein